MQGFSDSLTKSNLNNRKEGRNEERTKAKAWFLDNLEENGFW
jgi:hypothetical protein